jgi:hypothetical protein
MSRALPATAPTEPDLIDRIAAALPNEVRADYYREMRHCRSLPENDEILRILRAMQFLALLTQQAPGRIAVEREQLDRGLEQAKATVEKCIRSSETYHRELDRRLTALPAAVADGIDPERIAAAINENLRQQFVRSTIPQCAEALAAVAQEIKAAAADFGRKTNLLSNSYGGAVEKAQRAIEELETTVSGAAEAGKRAADNLSWTFSRAYRWSLHSLCAISLLLGLLLGLMAERWIGSERTPAAASVEVKTSR